MKRSLPLMGSLPALPVDEEAIFARPSSTSLPLPSDVEPPRKIRRQGSRVKSVLRSLTNSRQYLPHPSLGLHAAFMLAC